MYVVPVLVPTIGHIVTKPVKEVGAAKTAFTVAATVVLVAETQAVVVFLAVA